MASSPVFKWLFIILFLLENGMILFPSKSLAFKDQEMIGFKSSGLFHPWQAEYSQNSQHPPKKYCPDKIEGDYVEGEVLVKFHSNISDQIQEKIHALIGAKVIRTIPQIGAQLVRGSHGQSSKDLMCAYANRPEIEYVELNILFHPA